VEEVEVEEEVKARNVKILFSSYFPFINLTRF
jgi:hypothetical protein